MDAPTLIMEKKLIDDNNNMLSNFSANNLKGICLPGKNVSQRQAVARMVSRLKIQQKPELRAQEIKLTGQGMTQDGSQSGHLTFIHVPCF